MARIGASVIVPRATIAAGIIRDEKDARAGCLT